ncbi:phytoene synthase [Halogranum rubrum]|uniref:Phytoene synthase n=2 Tax=Halogranum rubrum TaxID=553466 RepID=A0A1I4C9S6_9EURY|nr:MULTISPECIES: phytoene/squalene synthase family protein [Halogranum]EJN58433.1 phytoene synthase [Halogranum salarium B-1]SFK77067.1 phytoene synthase [Halogranum rubrum]
MVDDDQIARSKEIQQRTGKTFHFATRVLPKRVREATYVLYAFFRVADEVVDDAGGATPDQQRETLERLRAEALGQRETDDAVLAAFSEMREQYDIDETDVDIFIDAMLTDITKSRYETYDELEAYMDGSAAAVGRMMTAVMDPDEADKALPHATALGEAFQLTNFLRDVREDVVERDRIYLPQTTLDEHGVTTEQIRSFEMDDRFAAAMRSELHRAEHLYKNGVAGIKFLPEDCQLAVLLAAVLYAEHHRLIRRRNYDVLSKTPQLSTPHKALLTAKTWLHWQFSKDPETVFRKVSTVSYHDSRHSGPEHAERLPTR